MSTSLSVAHEIIPEIWFLVINLRGCFDCYFVLVHKGQLQMKTYTQRAILHRWANSSVKVSDHQWFGRLYYGRTTGKSIVHETRGKPASHAHLDEDLVEPSYFQRLSKSFQNRQGVQTLKLALDPVSANGTVQSESTQRGTTYI
jgi:hypothetical protein